jgi:hypothetical protein
VVKLHGVDAAAAEFIVLRIGPEHAGQQHASTNTFGVCHGFQLFSAEKLKLTHADLKIRSATKELHSDA